MPTGPILVSTMAHDLVGSEILRIANEVRRMRADGFEVVDYTVGDFNPAYFPAPQPLIDGNVAALRAGATNYPPAMGTEELRKAVAEYYHRELGVSYTSAEILIGAGARPLIFTAFATLLDPGDRVIYGVPSWNNNHYTHLVGARPIEVRTTAQHAFQLTAEDVKPHIGSLNMIVLNSPLNPTGTVFTRDQLLPICQLIADENRNRERRGAKPCYIVYDQVYWRNSFSAVHVHPVGLVPELRSCTLYIDGISKFLASTGLRVGWMAAPERIMPQMNSILGHMGAWAPKAEQIATASYLANTSDVSSFVADLNAKILRRLDRLHTTIQKLKAEGLKVDSLQPQGGIYLSAMFDYVGAKTPQGKQLATGNDLRQFLLEDARVAMVPFAAFGAKDHTGWFRMSVGAVSEEQVEQSLVRLAASLRQLSS